MEVPCPRGAAGPRRAARPYAFGVNARVIADVPRPAPTRRPRRLGRWGASLGALLLAVLVVLPVVLPVAASAATTVVPGALPAATSPSPDATTSPTDGTGTSTGTSTGTTDPVADAEPPTVLVGVGGLRWTDVSRSATPTLWRMISDGSVASLNVRTAAPVTCPVDAWLTLSAGRRVSAPTPPGAEPTPTASPVDPLDPAAGTAPECVPLPVMPAEPPAGATGWPAAVEVPGWSGLVPVPDPAETTVAGEPGELAAVLDAAGVCSTAVGPGAAVMLADASGRVERYAPTLDDLSPDELVRCPVVVVDQGELPETTTERRDALEDLDDTLATLTDELPRGSRVLVAGVADTPLTQQGLQVVVDWRSGTTSQRWLTSEGTRRPGFVQLVDLSATLADDAGVAAEDRQGMDGWPLQKGEQRRMDVARTVENRQYVNVLTATIPQLMPALVGVLAAAALAAVGGPLLRRRLAVRRARRAGTPPPDLATVPGTAARRVLAAVLLLTAAAPVAAPLATLSRWWVGPMPTFVLTASLSGAAVVVAVVAWLVSRLLPRGPWRLATAVAGVVWLVLTVDGLTGTTLQQGSLLGPSPALGARFYGFNNITFAVYATAALVLAGGLASLVLARRGDGARRAAVGVVALVGVVSVVVDGWPAFGADLGGILALVPGFAVLALLVGRVRVTLRRLLLVGLATVVVVSVVAVVDWLLPGPASHLGAFVQRVADGDALALLAGKAAGAWATVANPAGAVALLACAAAAWAVLQPERWRLPEVAAAYRSWPGLRPVVVALVVVAGVGSVLNDSGVIIAVMVLVVAASALVASALDAGLPPVPRRARGRDAVTTLAEPGVRRMPTTLVVAGGGLLVTLLLTSAVLPPASGSAAGGEVAPAGRAPVAEPGDDLVVVGTSGLRWADVSAGTAPTLAGLLTDGASAAGTTLPTGAASRCAVGGWLALSAGQLADVTRTRADDGSWACPTLSVTTAADGEAGTEGAEGAVTVDGWDDLVALQTGGTYQARLGVLGDALGEAPSCATAVGPGAGVALAGADGTVARYRDLAAALAPGTDAFACPTTVVDAGDATPRPVTDPALTPQERAQARTDARLQAVRDVDATVRQVLDAVPATTTVLVVDVANDPGGRPALGTALLRPSSQDDARARFLTSAATRTDGVVRLLDVPATVLDAAAADVPARIDDTPFVEGSVRPADAASAADELADLTSRDLVRRQVYTWFVDVPFWAGLALGALALLAGPRVRRLAPARRDRVRRWTEGALLAVASLSAAAFLGSLTAWWRAESPVATIAGVTVLLTAVVAGLAALVPRRPVWGAAAVVAGITFVVLTLDALVGTPLNRASPLGSAPTFGARFYGFGNPTFSVYAVAAVVLAAAVAQWLVLRGRRLLAAAAVGAIGVVAMVVDVWPTLGADLGGGLVLVPTFVVVGLAASGARLTWRRFLTVAVAGVALVAAIGVADWLRPAAERSHLGRFVAQVVDGSAWDVLLRKAGYALRSVLGGPPVWVTVLVLVLAALVLFAPRRFTPRWFARAEAGWPLLRPAVLAMWVMAVLGSLANDFGVRIAMIALVPAVPLVALVALQATALADETPSDEARPDAADIP